MKTNFIIFLLYFLFINFISGQNQDNNLPLYSPESFQEENTNQIKNSIRIVFYNVENLFDIYDDSLKRDDEFTPTGIKAWNNKRFYKKINNIYKVLIAAGGWKTPAIIGLCEIENRYVLKQLIYKTPLQNLNYKIIHYESPDRRGIDVALLYRHDNFKPLYQEAINILFPFDKTSLTRDILYVKGLLFDTDTMHIFVNHWPSRYGGYMATKPKREFVASVLRLKVDSIFKLDNEANIIIMGDFNDEPDKESLAQVLNAKNDTLDLKINDLFNLMFEYHKNWKTGTHKFQEAWGVLDQFIVSAALLKRKNGLRLSPDKAQIFKVDFLMEKDPKHLGYKPFRTYSGPKYSGGYSDHLPIYLDLIYIN
ncbi:MAG: endonuclease/exonuclease/phosphatase family protein [Bacteroidales bacterium]|nr:endonuclease/exonuclease/phosphatase family protein [Bacteroidales bacterium]